MKPATFDMTVVWTVEAVVGFLGIFAGLHHGGSLAIGYATLWSPGALKWAADAVLLTALLVLPLPILGLYRPATLHGVRLLLSAGVVELLSVLAVWAVFGCGVVRRPVVLGLTISPAEMALYWAALMIGGRLLFVTLAPRARSSRDVVVIGQGPGADATADAIRNIRPGLFRVSLAASAAECRDQSCAKVAAPGAVVAAEFGGVVDIPTFWERQATQINLASLSGQTELVAAIEAASRGGTAAAAVRRTLDIAFAATLLVLTAPLMAITALLVKMESPGPVIYRQERLGLGGRPFTILKFRSMRADAERNGVAVWARVRDARVTRVGRFIRGVRIDELPQLWNILRGDMSLVGPRPERPALARELSEAIPFFDMRTLVKPGLTGWAQVNMAYTATAEEARGKLAFDLYYIKNQSLWLDLSILLSTVRVMVFQVGSR